MFNALFYFKQIHKTVETHVEYDTCSSPFKCVNSHPKAENLFDRSPDQKGKRPSTQILKESASSSKLYFCGKYWLKVLFSFQEKEGVSFSSASNLKGITVYVVDSLLCVCIKGMEIQLFTITCQIINI